MIPPSDTALSPLRLPVPAAKGRFVATRYSNLVRDRHSGVFHARAKVGGRLVRKSLKTRSIEAAKRALDKLLAEERARVNAFAPEVDGWRMGRLASLWLQRVEADTDLAPRAVDYRRETLGMIRRSWPELEELKPAAVSVGQCKAWGIKLARQYSASRFNGCVESLRGIFRLAMEMGLCAMNPALAVERKGYDRKVKNLPSRPQLRGLLRAFGNHPSRRRGSWLVRFLVYSGARPAAAAKVMPADVDLKGNTLSLPPIKHQHARLVVPMSKELRAVCRELLAAHPGGDRPLLPVRSPRKALATVCRELGLPRLTPYDLRHLFTTHLLEQKVAPAMVAALRGDKDGGAMLLKTYFHARQEAMARVVKRVRW